MPTCQPQAASKASAGNTGRAYPSNLELGIEKKPRMASVVTQHNSIKRRCAMSARSAVNAALGRHSRQARCNTHRIQGPINTTTARP